MIKSHSLFQGSASGRWMLESALAQPPARAESSGRQPWDPSQALRQPWGHGGIPNGSQMRWKISPS